MAPGYCQNMTGQHVLTLKLRATCSRPHRVKYGSLVSRHAGFKLRLPVVIPPVSLCFSN